MRQIFLFAGMVWALAGIAQPPDFKPDITRALFHTRLDESQAMLMTMDGKADNVFAPYEDEELNLQLTYQATQRIDDWQVQIEQDNFLTHQAKILQLRALSELVRMFVSTARNAKDMAYDLQWLHLPLVLDAYEQALLLHGQGKAITPALDQLPYNGALVVSNSIAFDGNPFSEQTRQFLLLRYLKDHPAEILDRLAIAPNYTYPYADSLLAVVARRTPERLLTFAQAVQTPLAQKIRTVKDPMVQLLVRLAGDNQGQLYMPFLHQIAEGTLSQRQIGAIVKDTAAYYRLLVKTQVENAGLQKNGITVSSARMASDMLKRKSLEAYVNTINGLHDFPAPVRFKSIQALRPEELYYLIVLNETEIYTSSYMYVYNRIFEQLPANGADSLLNLIQYDRYKKFITMASNYNTLDNFLGRMDRGRAINLMMDFVNNLDRGSSEEDIEDAVDVANAYGTITDSSLRVLIRNQVAYNLSIAEANNNRRAATIYRLEKLIMESSDLGNKVNISDSLGILPIYTVKNDFLRDNAGRIVMQMYFYGDGAGKGSFNTLLRLMGDRNQWKMTSTPQWVQWTSINTPVPFVLFANRALDEEQDLDEEAQRALIDWMGKNDVNPSITVHRGHSYYLKYTIEKMLPSSKVVVLGSCGAYHNLADVLNISPEAYIIASKQVGYGVINVQLFMYLINELKRGKDVAWPAMMEDVAKSVGEGRKTDFDDYIFPHRNLGAIFIKAYRKAMEDAGS